MQQVIQTASTFFTNINWSKTIKTVTRTVSISIATSMVIIGSFAAFVGVLSYHGYGTPTIMTKILMFGGMMLTFMGGEVALAISPKTTTADERALAFLVHVMLAIFTILFFFVLRDLMQAAHML